MPNFALVIEPFGDTDAVIEQLQGMARRATDMMPVFSEVVIPSFVAIEKEKFAEEGPGWVPLAASTAAFKAYYGFSPKILGPRTGMLENSLTSLGILEKEITPRSVSMFTTVYYAVFHQEGMGRNPLRKLVDLTPATALYWLEAVQEYVIYGTITTDIQKGLEAMATSGWNFGSVM